MSIRRRIAANAMTTARSKDSSSNASQRTIEVSMKLSPELKAFYESHNIHGVEELLRDPGGVRFVRLNPRHDKQETLRLLEAELPGGENEHSKLRPIPWMNERFGFYAVPGDFSVAQSKVFRSGRIYGMDVSSGAAVAALLSDHAPDLRVLDLCCSPGLKLCMIADLLPSSNATVVGVDISSRRLALCKNIVKKYHVDPVTSARQEDSARIRLYRADGTTFGTMADTELIFDSEAADEEAKTAGTRKRMNKSARARERKRLRQLSSLDMSTTSSDTGEKGSSSELILMKLFDRVLVDAECSTDGSLKHVQQRVLKTAAASIEEDEATACNPTLTDPKQLEALVELQKGLISSGFKLLKPGGVLVYSTCSLSIDQNEAVVEWLLEKHPKEAHVMPVSFPCASSRITEGSIKDTVRFLPSFTAARSEISDPATLFGGGFFVAKIGKRVEP